MDLVAKVKSFPSSSGVYLMKDSLGRILYVGKAKELKKRVASYLGKKEKNRYQIQFLMKRVADIDCLVTDNEKEALLLEDTLIKKHRPRYNLQLRDDKSYASIKLSLRDRFPRIYVTRQIKKDGSIYFGPYASASAARETVEFIERYFRLRTCSDTEFANRVRPCLQHQIHRCDAPCVGYIDEAAYRRLADQVKLFLQGKKRDLLEILENQMRDQSNREEFEKAAQTRNLIASIRETLEKQKVAQHHWLDQDVISFHREGERITFCLLMIREGKVWESRLFHLVGHDEDAEVLESFLIQFYGEDRFVPDEILVPLPFPSFDSLIQILTEKKEGKVEMLAPQRGDRRDLVDLAQKNAKEGFQNRSKKAEEIKDVLSRLQEMLHLQNFPRRMECFDISNIGGKEAVGSLVSFVEGIPSKEGYRRFKIKTVNQADDFGMMREVLRRRLIHLESADTKWEKPDLIVVDGGKGQLNAIIAVMNELNVTGIDPVSLAKEREGENQDKVFLPGRKNPVLLGRHSNLLHLLMRLRDEAHRFAVSYHRKLRGKAFLPRRRG
jgi:excinuclease ABC subunit C